MADEKKAAYKATLNLPRTSFDMRAGLLAKEPAFQASWRESGLYGRIREARAGAARFLLHDGPPYANGNIHMGTALNKVLKDMVVRLRTMEGMDSPYVPGWDCHGLPIEQKVMEELGDRAATMTPLEVRTACREYAEKYVAIQSEQFQRLGVLGDFEQPYITMDPAYEAATLEVFARLVEKGLVHRQLKPIHWSIENLTALADAELEYYDREDSSIFVFLPLVGDAGPIPHHEGDEVGLLVWTTTPWTLPANRAVAVHLDFDYAAVRAQTPGGPRTFLVAEDLRESVLADLEAKGDGWLRSHETLGTLRGVEILEAGLRYEHPILPGRTEPIVSAPYVTLDVGTGLVHTAPGHGLEDYDTGRAFGLEVACPVRADGTFDASGPDWLAGLSVWDANPRIEERLRERGHLALSVPIVHSYPHDWRSKGPTIFRATEQWFVAVDRDGDDGSTSLRRAALEVTAKDRADGGVDFVPRWGRNRIAGMLESRPDWCISRQRSWGLPIPVFYNENEESLLTPATVRAVAAVVGREGSDAWFRLSPAELLAEWDARADPDLADASAFAPEMLRAGRDIFDVWFEAGSSWFSAAIARGLVGEDEAIDLYLEGSDQHRGWFQLSLLPALGAVGRPPFAAVLTHGFVVTEDGHGLFSKMSKSLGNTIDVLDQLGQRGADVLRLWLSSQNYQDDVRCSEKLIAQSEDAYRKIRNTLRFCMGACGDFDPARHAREPEPRSLDAWMKAEVHGLVRDVRAAYDRYEFHRAYRLLYEFCTVQASSIHLNASKDRLYCDETESPRRRSAQTVIHEALMAMLKLLAPILPHTCAEAWDHVPNRDPAEPAEVALALLPEPDASWLARADETAASEEDLGALAASDDPAPARVWPRLLELRTRGLEKLEAIRKEGVKNPLETEVVFRVPAGSAVGELLEAYRVDLEDLLGAGHAVVEAVEGLDGVEVEVRDARELYERCARSWKRRPDVGSDPEYPDLSARDAAAVRRAQPTT